MSTLDRLVRRIAASTPEAPAVACGGDRLTYGELDTLADAYAARLAESGVAAGDRVVIHAAKSTRTVAAMQAVLRLGAAYVPVDGGAPADRARHIATDCGATATCADADEREAALTGVAPCLRIDQPVDALTEPLAATGAGSADDLAFVLYTSGSTGRPKGVCISHRNALSFVDWAVEELDAGPSDVFSNHASFGFDLSVLDLYGAFASGASVELIPSGVERVPAELTALLREAGVTIWYSVPSALMLMMREGGLLDEPAPEALRAILFAGEPFPIASLRRLAEWAGDRRLLNLYGPTETNVCTFHEVREEDLERDAPVPIGVACSGDELAVLGTDGTPVADGEEGELFVSGPTVMLGYWGREPQTGAYGTGDIVRRRPDGTLEYVGRRDHQVKVRGHRVELGEVEAAIAAHPDVEEVAVVVAGQAVEARLVAFVAGVRAPGTIAVKRACAQRLPASMVVDAVHRLDVLPRTPNGKVDRAALIARETEAQAAAAKPAPAPVAETAPATAPTPEPPAAGEAAPVVELRPAEGVESAATEAASEVFRAVVGLPDPTPDVDADAFREAMSSFPAAVSVITALDDQGTPRGLTCSAVCSLSVDPPLVLACVNRRNGSLRAIRHSEGFVVNLLQSHSHEVSQRFASGGEDKYDGVAWEPSPDSGLPRLSDDAWAHVDCRLVADIEAGSHSILIGGIRTCGSSHDPEDDEGSPLVYWRRSYGRWSAAPPAAAPEPAPVETNATGGIRT